MSTPVPAGAFVLDENLSPRLAKALELLDESEGVRVRAVTELFEAGTADDTLLAALGTAGAFLITRDTRQRKRPAELEAWVANSAGVFVLSGKNLERWEIVRQVVASWPLIKKAAQNTTRPFAYRVHHNGGKLEPISLAR